MAAIEPKEAAQEAFIAKLQKSFDGTAFKGGTYINNYIELYSNRKFNHLFYYTCRFLSLAFSFSITGCSSIFLDQNNEVCIIYIYKRRLRQNKLRRINKFFFVYDVS